MAHPGSALAVMALAIEAFLVVQIGHAEPVTAAVVGSVLAVLLALAGARRGAIVGEGTRA